MRPSRNRHGRGVRGPLIPQGVPRFTSRSQQFDIAVLEAYAPIHNSFPEQLATLDLAVDTVPRMRLSADSTVLPDDIVADGPVPLGRVLAAGIDAYGNPTRARLVVFRRPIEERSETPAERDSLLSMVLTGLVANYLNLDPRDLDPDFNL